MTNPMLSQPEGANRAAVFPEAESERVSAVEWVRRSLRKAIVRGDLPGGSRVVQTEIAAQLQVSTTPVREAMRDLAAEGLISLKNHRIGIVRKLNWNEMLELVEIRRSLEPLAAHLAIAGIDARLLDRAKALADELATERDVGEWVEKNNEFHNLFREATGTQRLASMLRSLGEATGVYVAQAQRLHPEVRDRAVGEHYQLIEAYGAGDLDEIIRIQHDHVALSLAYLQSDAEQGSVGVGDDPLPHPQGSLGPGSTQSDDVQFAARLRSYRQAAKQMR